MDESTSDLIVKANALFGLALEAVPTGMLMVDKRGRITLVNAQIEALFGYSREELVGRPMEMLMPQRFRAMHPQFRQTFFDAPQARAMGAGRDLYGLRKDGSEVPIEIGLNPLRTSAGFFVLSSVVDITEHRRAMEQLRERTNDLTASLKERDVLLQEIHHRVKNNLQVISSLINMQARKLESGAAREGLLECKSRVEAIALIHEKLYQSRDYAQVPFSEYARSLADSVVHAAERGTGVALDVQCDAIHLPVDKAISCGLILNELITNALKHAYPSGGGPLHIQLRQIDAGQVRLTVRDEGVGMPAERTQKTRTSLGLQLVDTLTQQLGGSLSVAQQGGTFVTVQFPIAP